MSVHCGVVDHMNSNNPSLSCSQRCVGLFRGPNLPPCMSMSAGLFDK